MKLQVKQIEGPSQIFLDEGSKTTTVSLNSATADNYNKFTCILNQNVEKDVSVTFFFYDNRGNKIGIEQSLTFKKENTSTNKFYFSIIVGKGFSGSYFYVQAIIPDADSNAQNVSFTHSAYHETIKSIELCAKKKITHLYWSDSDEIKDMEQEESKKDKATANDNRYIHIKAIGMYNDVVGFKIEVEGVTPELQIINVPLYRNRSVVKVNMKDALARYCSIKGLSGDKTKNLTINLKTTATFKDVKYDLKEFSNTMELTGDKAEDKENKASTGAVLVAVSKGDVYDDKPLRYTDFLIGYMCHIEGVGKLAMMYDNRTVSTDEAKARYTVYPFHVYEIMLSDLVKCGLVSIDEAAYLTTEEHKLKTLKEKAILQNEFNKITDEIAAGKTLLSLFQDSTDNQRANRSSIRKVLTQVCHKPTQFSAQDFICRDVWEIVSSRELTKEERTEEKEEEIDGVKKNVVITRKGRKVTQMHARPDTQRYSKHKECPFGEFFLNYIPGGKYMVYVSRNINDTVINNYKADARTGKPESPNPIARSAIAMHRGGAEFSTGCLTFNMPYAKGNYLEFIDVIYKRKSNYNATHISKLNFICIDERNAVPVPNDTVTYKGKVELSKISVITADCNSNEKKDIITLKENDSFNFNRYYDLIKPQNSIPVITETRTIKDEKKEENKKK